MPQYQVPRVQAVPQPADQLSFQVDGAEKLRWHFGPGYARPFFYPVVGPSGRPLTRMGHPAAPNHDHHKSLWVGHQSVGGVNFWEERGGPQKIRQEQWVHYQDGADEAGMVVRLGWVDAHGAKIMEQELIAAYRPLDGGEGWIELQTSFTSPLAELPLGRTNFGFFGLRVAASLSAHYGGGVITDGEGRTGESAVFAQRAKWVDYGGPVAGGGAAPQVREGITWFDHPDNPGHPASWHVRDDGWMSPAFCLRAGHTLVRGRPLVLRYGLHAHAGSADPDAAGAKWNAFAAAPAWEVARAERPWQWRLRRAAR